MTVSKTVYLGSNPSSRVGAVYSSLESFLKGKSKVKLAKPGDSIVTSRWFESTLLHNPQEINHRYLSG